jgi:dolichol-phosphate mannosyltransferase
MACHQGFTHINVIPYDIIHPSTPGVLIRVLQSLAFILEYAPIIRDLCGTLYIRGKKPGDEELRRPRVSLAHHSTLFRSTSVVLPCHNEAMNLGPLIAALKQMYDDYIHEIVIVDDNSTDDTSKVAHDLAQVDTRAALFGLASAYLSGRYAVGLGGVGVFSARARS